MDFKSFYVAIIVKKNQRKSRYGPVWLLFLKTVLENNFLEQFLVFLEKKNCIWELNFGKQFLFSKTKKKTYLAQLIKKHV